MYAKLSVAVAALIAVLSFPAFAQSPQTRDYLSELSGARASALADGRIIISLDAASGDLRGLLTLTLRDAGDGLKGTWAFTSTYGEDLRADGTPIDPADHVDHDHDDPTTPAVHREYLRIRRNGAIAGTVTAARLHHAADGQIDGLAADLVITGGNRTFAGITGSGRIGVWPSLPDALTLYLSF